MRRPSHHAFTIVELLVATAITVVIVVLLGTMFSSLLGTSSRTNQRIDAFRDARAALQMIERDLSGLVRTQWEPDPFTSPVPAGIPQPLTRPAAYLTLANLYSDPAPGNQQLYALISSKNSGLTDLCSVGYYCSWDGNAYSLRRFFRDSNSTYGKLASPAPVPGAPVYIPDTVLYTPNPSPSPTPTDDVLAQYVWNLKIIVYDASGNAFPYPLHCDGSAADPILPAPAPPPMKPTIIEISFRAMSTEAARTVIAARVGANVWMTDADPTYQRLIKPNAYEFKTRIKL